jgi:hypothetical protein
MSLQILQWFVDSYKLNSSLGAVAPTPKPQSGLFVYGVKFLQWLYWFHPKLKSERTASVGRQTMFQ